MGRYAAAAYGGGIHWLVLQTTEFCEPERNKIRIIAIADERRLETTFVPDGHVAAWVALQTVRDRTKDIFDVRAWVMTGRFSGDRADRLVFQTNPQSVEDAKNAADLREGLLAERWYKSYSGLRRNPMLTVGPDGEVTLCWEVRVEAEQSHTRGHLMCRVLQGDNTWGPRHALHRGGCGYAVPPGCGPEGVGAWFLDFSQPVQKMLSHVVVAAPPGPDRRRPGDPWARWSPAVVRRKDEPRHGVRVGEKTYHLFWADTHCHSGFSPDAEGEVDELVERNVEVCSSWRVCMEETDVTMKQLLGGRRLGFIGSSDGHRCVPGLGGALTGVYAEALARESLHEVYTARRLVATQVARVVVHMRVSGAFIGESGNSDGAPLIDLIVEAPGPIECVDVIRNGSVLVSARSGCPRHEIHAMDPEAAVGRHFYFARVKMVGDPSWGIGPERRDLRAHSTEGEYPHNLARARGVFAWSSPIWITVTSGR